jgi:hypothetical protein
MLPDSMSGFRQSTIAADPGHLPANRRHFGFAEIPWILPP